MSLDVYLRGPGGSICEPRTAIYIREDGATREISHAEWERRWPGRVPVEVTTYESYVYHGNITHNLRAMAAMAGLYEVLWRPDENGWTCAAQLVTPLLEGFALLVKDRDELEKHNPENGWGTYEGLVSFVADYLKACILHPEAIVEVSR